MGGIAFHNHPSSKLKPSQSDKDLTKKLADAARFFDMKILDHIILTRPSDLIAAKSVNIARRH